MKFGFALGLVLVTVGALVLRMPQLGQRPMHTDESVHAIKFLGLWEDGEYRYDPHEYHGPSLYYATLPVVWVSGITSRAELSEGWLRLTPVLFGTALILLLLLTRQAMGAAATLWAAAFLAASPAMVFYSRYYIHETLLVTFTFGFLACGWRYLLRPDYGWMLGMGVSLGLMQATKETFVFPVGAAIGAFVGLRLWRWLRCETASRFRWKPGHLIAGGSAFLAVYLLFFTSFFQNAQGPLDAWRTYGPWFSRAEGDSPHTHPWHYYLSLLLYTRRGGGPLWTEALIFGFGWVGLGTSLFSYRLRPETALWGRFLGFYTLLLTAAYSVVPYKTPWCLLGFWHGWILLAGIGVAVVWRWRRHWGWRAGMAVALTLGLAHLVVQAQRSSFLYADSQRNPYVYAHTLSSLLDLVERVEELERLSPEGTAQPVIKVVAEGGDYWPLPWYLREYRTGWYAAVPEEPGETEAEIVIASPQFEPALRATWGERVRSLGMFGLRPGKFLQLHVESELWERYLVRPRREEP